MTSSLLSRRTAYCMIKSIYRTSGNRRLLPRLPPRREEDKHRRERRNSRLYQDTAALCFDQPSMIKKSV